MLVYPVHRWVRLRLAADYLALGWLPLASLDGCLHGEYCVHFCWCCRCEPPEPAEARGRGRPIAKIGP